MSNEQYLRRIQTDARSTSELIQLALSQDDEGSEYRETLTVLHSRGTRKVLDAARALCRSAIAKERLVGVDILGRLGDSVRIVRQVNIALTDTTINDEMRHDYTNIIRQLADVIGDAREFPEEVVPILLERCAVEEDSHVLNAIITALIHYMDTDHAVIAALVKLAQHNDAAVRETIAFFLHEVDDPLVTATMINLMNDTDAGVRDWATFGLAHFTFTETDSAEIRNALAARLTDAADDVYSEAVFGLARYGDRRVIPALLSQRILTGAWNYTREALINAGKLIGDPRLLPLLLEEKKGWDGASIDNETDAELYQDLLSAIARSTQEQS